MCCVLFCTIVAEFLLIFYSCDHVGLEFIPRIFIQSYCSSRSWCGVECITKSLWLLSWSHFSCLWFGKAWDIVSHFLSACIYMYLFLLLCIMHKTETESRTYFWVGHTGMYGFLGKLVWRTQELHSYNKLFVFKFVFEIMRIWNFFNQSWDYNFPHWSQLQPYFYLKPREVLTT